jgi:imidazole glycerol-phosphate synthase subunit HisF
LLRTRVIPALLMSERRLIKTVRFRKRTYLGDPINTVKIFNDKEVDELILLDIDATVQGREPDYDYLERVASQAFMPLGYGGGITSAAQVRRLLNLGIEKVAINAAAVAHPELITEAAEQAGSQSVVASIDVVRTWRGEYDVRIHNGRRATGYDPAEHASKLQRLGAGEIFLNSVDRDGMMQGYDLDLISRVSAAVTVPVVACGGAGKVAHFTEAVTKGRATAVAAGSMFVFAGPHKAVLINFPSRAVLIEALSGVESSGGCL